MSSKRGLYVAQALGQDKLTAIRSMVAPAWWRRGIFTTLLEAARKECQRRQLPSLLFIVERQSASGQAFVAALQPQYDHSEYKMAFRSPPPELPASSENEHAPGLYTSGGFVQLSRYDYYRLPM